MLGGWLNAMVKRKKIFRIDLNLSSNYDFFSSYSLNFSQSFRDICSFISKDLIQLSSFQLFISRKVKKKINIYIWNKWYYSWSNSKTARHAKESLEPRFPLGSARRQMRLLEDEENCTIFWNWNERKARERRGRRSRVVGIPGHWV